LILEGCLVDCTVDLSFNWSNDDLEQNSKADSRVANKFPYLAGSGWTFKVTKENKAAFIRAFCSSFTSSDFCHFIIRYDEKGIGDCYDIGDSNFLKPVYFDRILLASKLDNEEVEIIYVED
jgi:hypothetical protein